MSTDRYDKAFQVVINFYHWIREFNWAPGVLVKDENIYFNLKFSDKEDEWKISCYKLQ